MKFFSSPIPKNRLETRWHYRTINPIFLISGAYPINTEIRTVKTFSRSSGHNRFWRQLPFRGPAALPPSNSTVPWSCCPENPCARRYYDDRVAYFTTDYTDFDADPQGVKDVSLITRWRLEAKPEDMEKFKKGELVEPRKPIRLLY